MSRRLSRACTLPLLVLAACSSVQDDVSKQILQPPPGWLVEPSSLGLDADPFTIELHSDASLTGSFVKSAEAHGRTVVLFHDEHTNVSVLHPYYTFLHERGFHVVVYDPRGFGRSKGTPTLQAWIYDVPALLDHVRARPDVDPQRIAYFGIGWGAVTALWAARTQGPCAGVVLEGLTSPRAIVREATKDDGSMLGALSTGMLEFAGMPDDVEPVEGAPRTKAPALFLSGELESERDRQAQIATFTAYGGDKRLWVLPGTRSSPHGLFTQDGEYQEQVGAFLRDAFSGVRTSATVEIAKAAASADGQSWYEANVVCAATGRHPIEIGVALGNGTTAFAHTWSEDGRARVRMKLAAAPAAAGAILVARKVVDDPDGVEPFVPVPTDLTRSTAAIEPLRLRIEALRNGALPAGEMVKLADDLKAAETKAPFDPRASAELADVFALLGKALRQRPEEARRREGEALLQRAVASVPANPERHVWPGASTTYGFPQHDAVEVARRQLAAPAK